MCMSPLTSCRFLLAPNCELVPALKPECTSPAVEEHATFAEAVHYLEHYLKYVCVFEKNEMGHAVPAPGNVKGRLRCSKDHEPD